MAQGRPEAAGPRPARRVLDPLARASEVLFGLIMALTFTVSLNATAAGREDVRAMLIGALGCNLAWGIIDAVMFLMGTRGELALQARTVRAVQAAESAADRGREMIADALPPLILPALSAGDLERIRLHLAICPHSTRTRGLGGGTIWAPWGSSSWSSSAPFRWFCHLSFCAMP